MIVMERWISSLVAWLIGPVDRLLELDEIREKRLKERGWMSSLDWLTLVLGVLWIALALMAYIIILSIIVY